MAQTETLHASACLRLGVCRNLVLTAWLDAPEGAHARAMGSAILGVSSRYGLDFGILDTIISGTPRFTDEFRDEIVKIVRDSRMQGHGAAHVVTLGGLGGVAVRAFLSTVFLLGDPLRPTGSSASRTRPQPGSRPSCRLAGRSGPPRRSSPRTPRSCASRSPPCIHADESRGSPGRVNGAGARAVDRQRVRSRTGVREAASGPRTRSTPG